MINLQTEENSSLTHDLRHASKPILFLLSYFVFGYLRDWVSSGGSVWKRKVIMCEFCILYPYTFLFTLLCPLGLFICRAESREVMSVMYNNIVVLMEGAGGGKGLILLDT